MHFTTAGLVALLLLVSDIGVQASQPVSGSKNYVVVKERVNYFAAMEHCALHNLRLATITSEKNQEDLKNAILEADDCEEWFWIGLTCLSKKGRFKWISTGEALEGHFQTWCENQPDNWYDKEDCVSVYKKQDYKWNDANCYREFYFVCEPYE